MKTYHKRKHNRKRNTKRNRKIRNKRRGGADNGLAPGFYSLNDMDNTKDKPTILERLKFLPSSFLNLFSKIKTPTLRGTYKSISTLGKGGFGEVAKWEDKITNKSYAVKKINNYKNQKSVIDNEIKILEQIKKQNNNSCVDKILCFRGAYIDNAQNVIYIATDVAEGIELDTLMNHIDKEKFFYGIKDVISKKTEIFSAFVKILSQIFESIQILNQNNICHNDLKPSNIFCYIPKRSISFFDFSKIDQIKIKIIDFGGAINYTEIGDKSIKILIKTILTPLDI